MTSLRLDIWSDVACPWCYVGKRRLEAAVADFPHAVEVVWRSFELDSSAPRMIEGSYAERLARKYHTTTAQGEAMLTRMAATAAAEGITMRYDKIRPGNTFDCHRLLHLASERGKQGELKERFLRGYFCEGEAVGDPRTLTRLAVEVGLDAAEVEAVLASDRYADAVRADQALARELEITGVPFFVFAQGEVAVSGALPVDEMRKALDDAWTAITSGAGADGAADSSATGAEADGEVCGPEGCS
jgi:predicted DsbA family dithiol-disulfide isomerase